MSEEQIAWKNDHKNNRTKKASMKDVNDRKKAKGLAPSGGRFLGTFPHTSRLKQACI